MPNLIEAVGLSFTGRPVTRATDGVLKPLDRSALEVGAGQHAPANRIADLRLGAIGEVVAGPEQARLLRELGWAVPTNPVQVFLGDSLSSRVAVPLQALLRALCLGSEELLQAFFSPVSLASLLSSSDGGEPKLVCNLIGSPLTKRARRDVERLLQAITSRERTAAAFASLFANAVQGRLAMSPPEVTFKLDVSGPMVGDTLFATSVSLLSAHFHEPTITGLDEAPIIFAGRLLQDHGRRWGTSTPKGARTHACQQAREQLRACALSDEEFEAVNELLPPIRRSQRSDYAGKAGALELRRLGFQAVRFRQRTGTSYTALPVDGKVATKVVDLYRQLKKRGTLEQALDLLQCNTKEFALNRIGRPPLKRIHIVSDNA